MAFSWNSVSAGTELKADDINQVKTHVDTLATNLGVSQYSWSEIPVSANVDETLAAQIADIQDAVDYIDTANVCAAHNATRYTSDNATNDATVNSTQNSTVDNDQHATYWTAVDNGVDGAFNATVYSPQYTSYNSSANSSVDSTKYGTVYSVRNAVAK